MEEHEALEQQEDLKALLQGWMEAPRAALMVPPRLKRLYLLVGQLRELLRSEECDASVQLALCPLATGDVTVSFETDILEIRGVERFCELLRQLKNFEVYALEDGRIHFSGVFGGVARMVNL